MRTPHPLTPGVTWVITRHLGPFKRCAWGMVDLADAARLSAALDRRQLR
ncbi:hypothetical protein [Micromonospora sp. NPDC005174]